jgi:hypothetical protein
MASLRRGITWFFRAENSTGVELIQKYCENIEDKSCASCQYIHCQVIVTVVLLSEYRRVALYTEQAKQLFNSIYNC